MSKAKAAAMVLAVIISLLAGCLLIATSASAGNNIKDNTLGLAKIENRQLSNNAATINPTESKSTTATNTTAAASSTTVPTTTAEPVVTVNEGPSLLTLVLSDTAEVIAENKLLLKETATEAATEVSTEAATSVQTETTTQAQEAATTASSVSSQPVTEVKTQPVTVSQEPTTVQSETQYIEPSTASENNDDTSVQENGLPISDRDYILLCNAVAHEAGSNWIDVYEKGKVVEVIMNRVASPSFPNTIYGVLTAPWQFTGASGYADLDTYSYEVTDMVKEAVTLYFNEPESFQHGYLFFTGDGYMNHFRVS
ncbi:MAG: cell wall hydrolase [Ruminococcus sp.]|nr:cell wall hydrolase [Ruminococcus sp.]